MITIDRLEVLALKKLVLINHALGEQMCRPQGNNADEWVAWFFETAGYGASFLGVQIAEAIDEHVERTALLDRSQVVRFINIDASQAICVGGRFDGWLMHRHPDGQWVTIRKLEQEYPAPISAQERETS